MTKTSVQSPPKKSLSHDTTSLQMWPMKARLLCKCGQWSRHTWYYFK